MELHLRSRDLDAIAEVADILAAPFSFDSTRSWALHAGERFRDLLGGDAAILYGSAFHAHGMWSVGLDSTIKQGFADYLAHTRAELRSGDATWDAALARRRAARLDVYTMDDVRAALNGARLEDQPIYEQVIEPSRLAHACGLATAAGDGETHLAVMSSRADRWRFGDNTRQVARLLLPAFRAGCGILSGVAVPSDGVAVLDHDGGRLLDSRRAELARRYRLTTREADVALLIASGLPRSQIAQAIGLSAHTVRHHTEAIFRKLNVHTRSAVVMALLRA